MTKTYNVYSRLISLQYKSAIVITIGDIGVCLIGLVFRNSSKFDLLSQNRTITPSQLKSGVLVLISVCLCVSVWLSAAISQKPRIETSPNLLCLLSVVVFRSSSDGVAIRYVLPVLWTVGEVNFR